MPQFRVEKNALTRRTRFRILSWGAVLLLVSVAAALLVLRASGHIRDGSGVGDLFALAILGAAVIAIVSAPFEGLYRAERKMIFILEDNAVVRKRQGYPDEKIFFSEINNLSEEIGRLIVTSTDPRRRIGIPYDVSGYEEIRSELAKHHELSARTVFPGKRVALPLLTWVSWIAFLWLRNVPEVAVAGSVAVLTLVFGSYRLWVLFHHHSKHRLLFWIFFGSSWLAALLLIYIRAARLTTQ